MLPWTMEDPGLARVTAGDEPAGSSVCPAYLSRPSRSGEGRPSGPRCGGGGVSAGDMAGVGRAVLAALAWRSRGVRWRRSCGFVSRPNVPS